MNILEQIVARKKLEVAAQKLIVKREDLEKSTFFSRQTLSLRQFLLDESRTGIIAEFKRKSPSKGMINELAIVEDVTRAYAQHASGISVLTDNGFFGGSVIDLQKARIHSVPILRKDFMIDEYQILEAKSIGADVILLIAACLSVAQVKQYAGLAKCLGMEVLMEVHSEEEFGHLCEDIDFVGINNRNLKTFEVDINTSLNLVNKIPAGKLGITESGISNVSTIVTLQEAGFKGFLIGENFMKETDPAIAFADFVKLLKPQLCRE
jgi:indole-3-glycerol phosphate synthase